MGHPGGHFVAPLAQQGLDGLQILLRPLASPALNGFLGQPFSGMAGQPRWAADQDPLDRCAMDEQRRDLLLGMCFVVDVYKPSFHEGLLQV
jgi:hypothetical protein